MADDTKKAHFAENDSERPKSLVSTNSLKTTGTTEEEDNDTFSNSMKSDDSRRSREPTMKYNMKGNVQMQIFLDFYGDLSDILEEEFGIEDFEFSVILLCH